MSELTPTALGLFAVVTGVTVVLLVTFLVVCYETVTLLPRIKDHVPYRRYPRLIVRHHWRVWDWRQFARGAGYGVLVSTLTTATLVLLAVGIQEVFA